jgi:Flp pilus assembly protein TadG
VLPIRPSRLRSLTQRFARAERGATAVEFALVSLPLLVLVFGVLELGLLLLVSSTLDLATQSAARDIRTGRFQTALATPTVTRDGFKALVCSKMTWLSTQCASQLSLDVRTFANFTGLASPPVVPATAFLPPANPAYTRPCFSPGVAGDKVLVRAYFDWKLFTPLLNVALDNTGVGSHRLTSTTAFQNEPYNANPAAGAQCSTAP